MTTRPGSSPSQRFCSSSTATLPILLSTTRWSTTIIVGGQAPRTNIRNSRGQNRRQFYQDLFKVHLWLWLSGSRERCGWQGIAEVILQQLRHYLDLMGRVIDPDRRVLQGQKVPAEGGLDQEHSDIIQTGGRETIFGHKIFLTCGKTSPSGHARQSR